MHKPMSTHPGKPSEWELDYWRFQRLTHALEAYSDLEESYDKLIVRLADVNGTAATAFASATLDAREALAHVIEHDVTPAYQETRNRLRHRQAKRDDAMGRYASSTRPDTTGGGDHHE
ncbi:hypothetical protein [Nesterenkonia muleiensis]|uniref:hypothetical protein n=1 Tax=Nesterenkonia muleiensis TaxID=2282648 RepID=UPI000E73F3EA|nr:hypothetical protein [Nesterenkonia muleiensis]